MSQIENGMAADVFMSAATEQMNNLVKGKYISKGDVVELLENKVVLIAPKKGDAKVSSFKDITKADTIALGDPKSVPAGQYAQEIFTNLKNWNDVKKKASFGTNVTEVLNWVAKGSASCGVVYATAVWVGRDDNRIMESLSGASYPKSIWSNFMNAIHSEYSSTDSMGGNYTDYQGETTQQTGTQATTATESSTKGTEATTAAPTTAAPTTAAPTTAAPTTAAQQTEEQPAENQ